MRLQFIQNGPRLLLFFFIHNLTQVLLFSKEIAEINESDGNLEQAIAWYEKASDLFQSEEVTTSANQCRQKVAQFAAQLEQYVLVPLYFFEQFCVA